MKQLPIPPPPADNPSSSINDAYEIIEKVSEGTQSIVYRGRSLYDGQIVIVKGLRDEVSNEQALRAYEREAEIAEHLQGLKGVAQLIVRHSPQHRPLIVYQDKGATSLDRIIARSSMAIAQKTGISIKISDALAQIHSRGIVHRDVNPTNIIYSEKDATVEIIDFGLSRFDLSGHEPPLSFNRLQEIDGTLPYISPEQTGRLLGSVDRRSDLYALGATLYELFTGRPPFDGKDPQALIQDHIAVVPVAPCKRQPAMPLAISNIIMKLLEKRPKDRYQSARGVKADLQKCLFQLSSSGIIEPFILGAKDIPDDLNMAERLYGRTDEIQLLNKCLEKSLIEGAHFVLVEGEAGCGKTALIHEQFRLLAGPRGRFIEGRAMPQNDAHPYAPIIQAVRGFLSQMLCASDKEITRLRSHCEKRVAPFAAACAHYFPELCDIWPTAKALLNPIQSPIVTLPAVATIIKELIYFALKAAEGPLVLFLDDMQYSDPPAQTLLAELIEEEKASRLLCIVAMQHPATRRAHPLDRLVTGEGLQIGKTTIMRLAPLGLHETVEMISDIFHLNKDDVFNMGQIFAEKSGGNPSRIRELLVKCTSCRMIAFNPVTSRWGWDIDLIRTMPIMDNVIDAIRQKLGSLSPETYQTMVNASVWGLRFVDTSLATMTDSPISLVKKSLREALLAGVIQELDDETQFPQHFSGMREGGRAYAFFHERIRTNLYQSLDDPAKRRAHATISNILLAERPLLQVGPQMERLAYHLNRGGGQDVDSIKLIRINHAAYLFNRQKGIARDTEYLKIAASLFADKDRVVKEKWQGLIALDLMWDAYHGSLFEVAERYACLLLDGTPPTSTRHAAFAMKIAIAARQGRLVEADAMSEHWLRDLADKNKTVRFGLRGKDATHPMPSSTADHLSEGERRHLLRFVLEAGQSALSSKILMRMIAEGLAVSGEDVASSDRAIFEFHHAILLTGQNNTLPLGRKKALGAIKNLTHPWSMAREGSALLHFADHLHHFTGTPPQKVLEDISTNLAGADNVDLRPRALVTYVALCLYHGISLERVEKKLRQFADAPVSPAECNILAQLSDMIARLSGQTSAIQPKKTAEPYAHLSYESWLLAVIGMITSYLLHDHDRALAYAHTVRLGRAYYRGGIHGIFATYYDALLITENTKKNRPTFSRFRLVAQLHRHMVLLGRWAKINPAMYQHRLKLLRTTAFATERCPKAAQLAFEQAVDACEKAGSAYDLALAHELAGRFYLDGQRESQALSHLKKAMRLSVVVGSLGKVQRLGEEFPVLEHSPITTSASAGANATGVDLGAMREALTAIVSEAIAMRMLQKVLAASLRFLGAERGVLILRKEKNRYEVEIEGAADGSMTPYYRAIPSAEYPKMPQSVINYVKRSKKTVIMHKNLAYDEGDEFPCDLLADPYLVETGVKSVLCYPIVLQGSHHVAHSHLVAILYLENRLVDGCFSADRVETLKIICLAAAGRLELSIRASTDGLTGLYNYDHFQSMLQREFLQAQRQSTALSMLMIDIDHFKTFNDQWGHLAGDRVLKEVAHVIQTQCRKTDIVARYGGEEMAVILPGTTTKGAILLAERIRNGIESLGVSFEENLVRVTASIGVASLASVMNDKEGLVGAADKALYVSKNRGRNCVSQA